MWWDQCSLNFFYRFIALTVKIPIVFLNTQVHIKFMCKCKTSRLVNILKEGRIQSAYNCRYQYL